MEDMRGSRTDVGPVSFFASRSPSAGALTLTEVRPRSPRSRMTCATLPCRRGSMPVQSRIGRRGGEAKRRRVARAWAYRIRARKTLPSTAPNERRTGRRSRNSSAQYSPAPVNYLNGVTRRRPFLDGRGRPRTGRQGARMAGRACMIDPPTTTRDEPDPAGSCWTQRERPRSAFPQLSGPFTLPVAGRGFEPL
jgi:hypothetical protein